MLWSLEFIVLGSGLCSLELHGAPFLAETSDASDLSGRCKADVEHAHRRFNPKP